MPTNLVRFEKGSAAHWGVVLPRRRRAAARRLSDDGGLIERGEADWREARQREPSLALESLEDPLAGHRAVPRLLPGRELPAAHDRVRHGSGRQGVQHVLHQDRRVDQPGDRRGEAAGACGAARLRDRTRAGVPARDPGAGHGHAGVAQGLCLRRRHRQRLQRARRAVAADAILQGQELSRLLSDRAVADRASSRTSSANSTGSIFASSVNGVTRQSDSTANLVFKPAETITELSTFADIAAGDVLLTGTPSGCALRVPPPAVRRIVQLLPERQFWKLFLKSQSRRPEYLQPGDRINATIRSADGQVRSGGAGHSRRLTISAACAVWSAIPVPLSSKSGIGKQAAKRLIAAAMPAMSDNHEPCGGDGAARRADQLGAATTLANARRPRADAGSLRAARPSAQEFPLRSCRRHQGQGVRVGPDRGRPWTPGSHVGRYGSPHVERVTERVSLQAETSTSRRWRGR